MGVLGELVSADVAIELKKAGATQSDGAMTAANQRTPSPAAAEVAPILCKLRPMISGRFKRTFSQCCCYAASKKQIPLGFAVRNDKLMRAVLIRFLLEDNFLITNRPRLAS